MWRLQILLLYLYNTDVVLCGVFFTSTMNNRLLAMYLLVCSFLCSILMHKIYGKESIHPSLGEKNSTNREPPVVSCILVVFYVQMYVYLVQDRVFHTGSAIFHVTSSAYSRCIGLAFGPVTSLTYMMVCNRVILFLQNRIRFR